MALKAFIRRVWHAQRTVTAKRYAVRTLHAYALSPSFAMPSLRKDEAKRTTVVIFKDIEARFMQQRRKVLLVPSRYKRFKRMSGEPLEIDAPPTITAPKLTRAGRPLC